MLKYQIDSIFSDPNSTFHHPRIDYTMAYEAQSNHITQVTILIAGRPYLLQINAAEEALVHRLANEINDKVVAFQSSQPSRDLQDCFALTLFTYAVEAHRAAQKSLPAPVC